MATHCHILAPHLPRLKPRSGSQEFPSNARCSFAKCTAALIRKQTMQHSKLLVAIAVHVLQRLPEPFRTFGLQLRKVTIAP